MVKGFKHKGLAEFFATGKSRKVAPELRKRIRVRLDAIDAAASPAELNQPGFNFHPLHGKPQRYSIHVNGPWCITFEWAEGNALLVDLEQYHWAARRSPMIEYTVKRPIKRAPTHPGELMREILDEQLHLPIAQAARRMKISRQSLYAVLNGGSAVTADMALRFGRLVGGAPELYLRMQENHDLWHARQKLAATLKDIVPVKDAA